MATGYLVGTGQNPYIAQDLSAVFQNLTFQNITTVGYPPPWPLLLGLIYRVVYCSFSQFSDLQFGAQDIHYCDQYRIGVPDSRRDQKDQSEIPRLHERRGFSCC